MSKHKALAYYRTSSAANVGLDKDSLARQQAAVESYCKTNGIDIVESFYDAAVSGADAIDQRPGFAALLKCIAGNGVRAVLVETASRFARDLIVQETGWRYLQGLGIELIAADSPAAFVDDTPTAVLVRQILGAVAQFEKAALVSRLAAARRRTGRTGGQVSLDVSRPEVGARCRELRALDPSMTLRAISARLADEGLVTSTGKPFNPGQLLKLLA